GYVDGYDALRRDLLLAVRPDLFPNIKGTTDSELLFHLALTFGLADDPIADPLQMTVGVTDGERLWAARYASGSVANTLHYSAGVESLRELYPENERFAHFGADSRVVVSEPLSPLPGVWHEIPAGTALVLGKGQAEQVPFRPRPA